MFIGHRKRMKRMHMSVRLGGFHLKDEMEKEKP